MLFPALRCAGSAALGEQKTTQHQTELPVFTASYCFDTAAFKGRESNRVRSRVGDYLESEIKFICIDRNCIEQGPSVADNRSADDIRNNEDNDRDNDNDNHTDNDNVSDDKCGYVCMYVL